jgi:hypothetical protein
VKKLSLIIFFIFLALFITQKVIAAEPSFKINSLTANYYLDRDSKGISTLAAEEAFDIKFPSSGASFTGFSRTIPTQYQRHTNELKITGVTDASGTNVPYKTNYDGDKNLVITVGNPSITVFGSQTYFIRYQAKGVINFLSDHQEFYPNFNGRGWSVPFSTISAQIHLTSAVADNLSGKPECLIDAGKCTVEQSKEANGTLIRVSSQNNLAAHQSLTAKLSFKQDTFQSLKTGGPTHLLKVFGLSIIAIILVLGITASIRESRKKIQQRKK